MLPELVESKVTSDEQQSDESPIVEEGTHVVMRLHMA